MSIPKPATGQGPAVRVLPGSIEETRDAVGFTHPNLHRLIDEADEGKIQLGIYGKNSYLIEDISLHDEESTDSEIP